MKPDLGLADRQLAYGLHFDAMVLHCPSVLRTAGNPIRTQWEAVCDQFFADPGLAKSLS